MTQEELASAIMRPAPKFINQSRIFKEPLFFFQHGLSIQFTAEYAPAPDGRRLGDIPTVDLEAMLDAADGILARRIELVLSRRAEAVA